MTTTTSASATFARLSCAGGCSLTVKYFISAIASPALITASSAAATKDRPTGNSRSSLLCEMTTSRRFDRSPFTNGQLGGATALRAC
jgi:hypothetical protein